jgi:hypothetical protein
MFGARMRPSPGRRSRGVAAAIACLLPSTGAAADPGVISASRTSDDIHLDGRLDEAAWSAAPPFSAFVESFPRPGLPASFRTEVRVLYDEEKLYVGVTCSDPDPGAIVRQLARRDGDPVSDLVEIAIDSGAGGRTAYDFSVNAAGVLRDQLLFGDVNATASWDAVWDAAVSSGADGWTAELAIPFHQLRFSSAREQRWGIVVRRVVPRTHQIFDSTPIPREANPLNPGGLVVSRFGRLEGIVEIDRGRRFELLPYAAARLNVRPQYSDPARPQPTLVDPAVDVGLDFKTALGSGLTLTGAINPDFGQVETDQVIQNLQNAEPFFPEKRPFFLEGLEIFEPVGSEYGIQQGLFYSRRIGLDAPILGALKVTGDARPGLQIGVLDAVVMGAGNASLVPIGYTDPDPATLAPYEADPDRRWRLRARQPFHFGPEDALPNAHPVTTNYLAAVARQRFGAGTTVGATITAATPLEPRCLRSEFATDADYEAAQCASWGSNAIGADVNVPGDWGGFAQVSASQAVGGPPEGRILEDGTVLKAGDLGFGGHLRAGKLGGEPWRFDVTYVYEDRKLDLNGVGYQPLSDFQWADLDLGYVRPNGLGPFRSFQLTYLLDVNWTADGRLPRGINSNVLWKVQLPGYQTIGTRIGVEIPQYDTREIAQAGVPFERVGNAFVALIFGSDPNRRLQANGDVFAFRTLHQGGFEPETGVGLDLSASWRPHDRLETRLDAAWGDKPQGPRWIETLPDSTAVFGLQHPKFVSVTLRQQLVFTPRLSAQIYAQYFASVITYGSTFYGTSIAGKRQVALSDLAPVTYAGGADSRESVLNLNAVLRWEYRLGSTLYLVYTRSQSELPAGAGPIPVGLAPSGLFAGPVDQTVLVKWTYWWET